MKNLCFSLALLFFFCGCQEDSKYAELLPGTWKVASIYENNQLKDMNTTNIQFSFNENGQYTYRSNAEYQEAGPYYIERKLLYTTDTVNAQRIKKSVKIKEITADSLFLDMNQGGIPQLWKLYRN